MAAVRKRERIHALAKAVAHVADADRRLRLAAAAAHGVGATDFDVLVLLDAAGPIAAGRIAEAMAITTGAVTGLIDRLERAGWVQRTRHEADRRQVLIELAPARRARLEAHWKERERLVAEALEANDEAELAPLLDAIAERTLASLARPEAPRDGASDNPSNNRSDNRSDKSSDVDRAPIGSIAHGRLRFATGVSRVELRGARIKDLYRATFHGKRPQIAVEPDGLVALQYKGFSWFGMTGVSAELALTTAVPWAIEIRRGVSHLKADLRELEITSIDISGGASECELALPLPRGLATVRITGGASKLVVVRPRGAAAQVVIRGGASNLVFDDQRIGAVGGATRLSTPSWDGAADRWTIELTGGASSLSVTEQA